MQTGTEILLARMKEYPEEFTGGLRGSRWMSLIDDAKAYLPGEDVTALADGLRQMRIDRFNERVLARLAGEDREAPEESKTAEEYNAGWNDPRADALRQKQLYESQYQIQKNLAAQGTLGGLGQSTLANSMASVAKGFF